MTDFLLAYTIHGSVILLIEVILLMVTTFAILGVRLIVIHYILYLMSTVDFRLKEPGAFFYMLQLCGSLV